MRTRGVAALACLALVGAACGSDGAETVDDATDAAADAVEAVDEGIDDFAQRLRDEGLESVASAFEDIDVSELTDSTEFTFLAPNDEAFQSVDADDLADLLADPERVTELLKNHTIAERYTAAQVVELDEVSTEAGETLDIDVDGDVVQFEDATVVATDIEAGDGMIHVVDGLLLP